MLSLFQRRKEDNMGRILRFQQIVDSRMDKGTEAELKEMLANRNLKLGEALMAMGLTVSITEPVKYEFPDGIQYRSSYSVQKNTRKITWNDVYGTVNRYKAVPYHFC